MLRILEIEDRQPVHELLTNLQQDQQTWVLSDLRTKFEIQDFFLKEKGFYTDESVLRISDLWKKILHRIDPEVKILTPQATQMHLRHFLRGYAGQVDLKDNSDPTLLKWMKDLAVLNFHPESVDRLEEWFEAHPEQKTLWKDWWLRARAAFAYFESQKLFLPQWIPAYLQTVLDLSRYWSRELFVDLGGQLTAVEAGLLQTLSRHIDVTVLAPKMSRHNKYSFILKPYQDLKSFAKETETHLSDANNKSTQTFRFASTLGAIRQTTAQVRKWVETGVSISEIAVVAPDIESLWPVLKYHLDQEGLPYNKETVAPYQAQVDVQIFLSRLRALAKNLSLRDLELSYYHNLESPDLIYEKFEALFKNLYDEGDYLRHGTVKRVLESGLNLQKSLTADEFLVHLMAVWNDPEVPQWLELLLREILGSFDSQFQLPWKEWVLFCETCLAQKEQVQQYANPDGVFVTNIMSAHFLKCRKRIFLELSEECLKSHSRKGLPSESSVRLAQELGFWLENSDQSSLEFELEWLLQDFCEEDHLYFSVARLNGQTQTPSALWLERAGVAGHENIKIPEATVHDSHLVGFSLEETNPRLLVELGQRPEARLKAWNEKNLSPSALENFHKCPFIYYANNTLGLKTFPEVDLDQNRRDMGQVTHTLFERILKQGVQNWPETRLDELLEELRPTHFPHLTEEFWSAQKSKFKKLSMRFIEFENEWKKKFPKISQHYLEVKWEGEHNGMTFRGQIDRIDQSSDGQLVLIDYKSTSGNLKSVKHWLKEGQLQMLFYIIALERGWVKEIEGEVVAALYYVVKNFTRAMGLEVRGQWPGFYENTTHYSQIVEPENKVQVLQDFENFVDALVDRLKQGEIAPQPADEKYCSTCDWRKICRSTHLN